MPTTDRLPDAQAAALIAAARGFGIPGLAVALVAPGRRALLLHGEAAAGSGRPVDGSTWFSVASLGKHVTAAAVLALAQQGRLDLAAPIGTLMPDLPAAWADRPVATLLHHTSGLPEYLAHQPGEPVPTRRRDFMATYGALVPAFGAGQGWMYTNTNYILAGMLIAQLTGRPYAEAVQAIFARSGCPGATVGGPDWARQADAAPGPVHGPDPALADREVIGDGDVCFTPEGALRWLEVLLGQGLLDAKHSARMFGATTLTTGRPALYGGGWFIEPLGAQTIVHHGGHFDGWTAMALLHPGLGCGVVAMCNQAPGHTRHIRHLAQLALEGFCAGATPLAQPAIADDDPALTARILGQLLRPPGSAPELSGLADELRRVAEHGSPVRTVPNLNTGVAPRRIDLVQRQALATHHWHRYRLGYADRTEHVLVGTTPEGRLHWAWAL